MKASALIELLSQRMNEHGDLPVGFDYDGIEVDVRSVDVYDNPDSFDPEQYPVPPTRIFLIQNGRSNGC